MHPVQWISGAVLGPGLGRLRRSLAKPLHICIWLLHSYSNCMKIEIVGDTPAASTYFPIHNATTRACSCSLLYQDSPLPKLTSKIPNLLGLFRLQHKPFPFRIRFERSRDGKTGFLAVPEFSFMISSPYKKIPIVCFAPRCIESQKNVAGG